MNKKCGQYSVGDELSGTTIARIIGQTENIVVCSNPQGTLVYSIEEEKLIKDFDKKTIEMRKLLENLPSDGNLTTKNKLRQDIGFAFFTSCNCSEGISTNQHFSGIGEKVQKFVSHAREMRYKKLVFFNIIQLVVSVSALYLIRENSNNQITRDLCLFMIGGSIGASLSLLQRNNKIDLTSFNTILDIQLSAFLSTVLGLLAGFIIYWVSVSSFVPTALKGDLPSLFLLSIIAGSSERLFNALVKKVEKAG